MIGQILKKLIKKEQLTDEDLVVLLNSICEDEHFSCKNDCPIYTELFTVEQKEESRCPYFKNGEKMLNDLYTFYYRLSK